ncbi:hypothetical protein D477_010411 [Arthrobacter crystallopoietes BAB-32]|uniref:Uncharacterized protein n=1 Tax=Arthrobacter crystallopoietes BAB-32 TaxID=1246476 RepID=N1V7W0_9MICC|nr:hypothetical protein [Arthrobacter crystallopoietes]EMY34308.1 hypothetical protein D477_010411 [Arthrobacter crystallopoietes BAB-32]
MSVISKAAAGILTAALLLSAGATAASASETGTVSDGAVVVEETVTLITQADVDAAHAAFKQAQADARTSEKQARTAAAAQKQLLTIRKANQASLKKLIADNRAEVSTAKAEYQRIAEAFEAQETAAL